MSNMFSNCSILSSLPDLSKWNINEEIEINGMFANCTSLSLSSIPEKFIKKKEKS